MPPENHKEMNMDKKAKIAAAISAAVINYIRTEEEITAAGQSAGFFGLFASGAAQTVSQPALNVWGISGRQAIMQTRNLMQMKAFGRSR
jgi:hypothetical protein